MVGLPPARFTLTALLFVAAMTAAAPDIRAQGRDKALESVKALTAQLIDRTRAADTPDSQIWAGVQALTDALRRFALAETETRADEKVESPPLASLRPGQAEATDLAAEPGPEVAVAEVPREWFNSKITEAQAGVNAARSAVERDASRSEIAQALETVRAALSVVNRPPAP